MNSFEGWESVPSIHTAVFDGVSVRQGGRTGRVPRDGTVRMGVVVMTDIAPVGGGVVGRSTAIESSGVRGGVARGIETKAARGADRVEVSRMASLLNQLREMPEIREDLVARVREQIAAGDYDSPERIDGAIDGLISEHSC
jgi:negative regulator of flagellin synthesis FlgM